MSQPSAPATVPPAPAAPREPADGGRWSSALNGAGELLKLAVRRDRMVLPVWIYVLLIIDVSGGYAVKLVYKTQASRVSLASTVHHDAALGFIYGQLHGDSYGAVVSWRYLVYAAIAAALMNIFLVIRHSRADEEAGRLELIGSTVVGRHAALTAALLVALLASVVGLVLTTAIFVLYGLPVTGAFGYALSETGCGLVFAAVAAITAQVSGTARGARGISIGALVAAFLLRGVGDSGASHGLTWLSWLSPIGWAEEARPFAGDRWWVFAVAAAVTIAGTAAAFVLAGRRDLGAGLVPIRPGPGAAARVLAGPVGLVWRLQRAGLAGWSAGFFVGGLAVGVVGNGIGQLLGSTGGGVEKVLDRIAAQSALTNAYLGVCTSLFALAAAGYATSTVLRLRTDETDGLGEPILASPVSRYRWSGSYLLAALAGTAVVLLAGGIAMGLGYGLASSGVGTWVSRMIGASLVQLPAALCVAGVAFAAIGLLPRWSSGIGWAAVAVCALLSLLGPAVRLSQGVLDISPFTHVPKLPGGQFGATPVIWLCAVAVALSAAGVVGLRRRDIG